MDSATDNLQGRAVDWISSALPSSVFLLFGARLIFNELPQGWYDFAAIRSADNLLLGVTLLLPSLGFALGWIKGFPRWSYAYLGMMITLSLLMQNSASPGFRLGAYELFGGGIWGLRAWLLPGLGALVGLIGSRSLQPIRSLPGAIWLDWTKLTYALFGGIPLLIVAGFDGVDRAYSLVIMSLLSILLIVTSLSYLHARSNRSRILALLGGSGMVITTMMVAVEAHWAADFGVAPFRVTGLILLILAILFSPSLFGLLRRMSNTKPVISQG